MFTLPNLPQASREFFGVPLARSTPLRKKSAPIRRNQRTDLAGCRPALGETPCNSLPPGYDPGVRTRESCLAGQGRSAHRQRRHWCGALGQACKNPLTRPHAPVRVRASAPQPGSNCAAASVPAACETPCNLRMRETCPASRGHSAPPTTPPVPPPRTGLQNPLTRPHAPVRVRTSAPQPGPDRAATSVPAACDTPCNACPRATTRG
jgi:hypothetical protein